MGGVSACEFANAGKGALTLHEELLYVPDRLPLLHVLVCETQLCPEGTEPATYAVTDCPLDTVVPLNVQD
jgi:hypothetical protein